VGRFTVGIVGRDTKPHARCFEDFALALADALRVLGHELAEFDHPGRMIMFGAGKMTDPAALMPADAILYNTEQLPAFRDARVQVDEGYRGRVVWDYSAANIVKLREMGIVRAVHCPLGYVPSMTMIGPAPEEDVDVLFYGSINRRRRGILDALDDAGLRVARLFDVYGKERDEMIARSKIVLNLHFYEPAVFEIFRVSHLLANKKCVVTEGGGQDEGLEMFARRSCVYTSRGEIVQVCRDFVRQPTARRVVAERGHAEFKKLDLVEHVRAALEQSA
jgi:hypothetical protein